MRREPENPSENLKEFSKNSPRQSAKGNLVYEFGAFRLDPGEHLLLCEGKPVPLSTKAFETLVVLVKNSGRLVTKNELIQKVWPNTFVEEGNLTQNISILRKSLGESHNGEQYIKTVPKVGYRFAAKVREFCEQEAGSNALDRARSEITNEDTRSAGDSRWIGKVTSRRKVLLALAAVAVVALAIFYFVQNGKQNQIDSLAVLPFTVVSGLPDTEYLADGIAESIISNLTQLPNLKVTSFASVARYKGRPMDDVQVLGKQLGVRAVLSTRIIQSGDELSINTELVDTKDYRRAWGQQYKRRLSNIIGLQEEVANDISEKLQAQLTTEERRRLSKRYTESAEAYRLYLQGRYFWNKRTAEGRKKAIEHFQKAAEADPNYSLAYAGLADAYLLGFGPIPATEHMPKARKAALQALQLDETLGDAHTSLGLIKARFEWDWPGAEKEFRRAIELNTSYATAHERYGRFLMWVGRKQEATAEILRAQQLDPISLIISTNVAEVFYFSRDYERAIVEARKVIEMDPNFPQARWRLAETYEEKGMHREALTEYLKWMSLSGASRENVDALQRAYESSGIGGFWRKLVTLIEHNEYESYISSRKLASMYARLGEKDQAFGQLEKACRERDTLLVELKVDPAFDSLRSDPRFVRLLHLIGLAS
jgi:DNA-binding winged helix-turn-helix (wHTH) protein/TolB-like protein